ncbi:DUF4349 domain-containing protein [bacterium]|nr:DUF4349 domain-containing protein [bacterium]
MIITASGCAKRSPVSSERDLTSSDGAPNSFTDISGAKLRATSQSPAGDQLALTDRKIIFNANMSLDVTDAEKALGSCELLAARYGGFVAESSLVKSDTRVIATATLRVPADKTDQLVSDLAAFGTVTSRSSGSQDVTSQYIDIQARLKVLWAEEEQLVSFLKKTTDVKDMLAVEDQLAAVRTEIEQYEGQQRYLDTATSLATVTVQLVQTTGAFVTPRGFGSAFMRSLVGFEHGLAAFWTWLGGAIVFILFYGLLLWAVTWTVMRIVRRRGHRSQPPQA